MQAKHYLRQAYRLNEKIKDKKERIESLKSLVDSIGAIDYSKDKVQTGQKSDATFVDQIAKIHELEEELNADLMQMCQLQLEISQAIDAVNDVNYSLVLSKRYLLMKTWDQIAEEMDYSVVQIHRIHKKALESFKIPKHDM